jgi:hypothetical protein
MSNLPVETQARCINPLESGQPYQTLINSPLLSYLSGQYPPRRFLDLRPSSMMHRVKLAPLPRPHTNVSRNHLLTGTIQNLCKQPVSAKALYSFLEAGRDLAYNPTEYVLERGDSVETGALQNRALRSVVFV